MHSILDYKRYKEENNDFLNMLESAKSIVYDRLHDVFKVLGYIELQYDMKKMDSDLEIIFESGFAFLFDQIELIKVFYHDYFKNNYPEFCKYETVINYFLYLDDLSATLEEDKNISKNVKEGLNSIIEKVDQFLLDKKEDIEAILDEVDRDMIELNAKNLPLTTIEVFGLIAEELEI